MTDAYLIVTPIFLFLSVLCWCYTKYIINLSNQDFALNQKEQREASEIEEAVQELSKEFDEYKSKVDALTLKVGMTFKK